MSQPKEWQTVQVKQAGEVQAGRQRSVNITKGTIRPYLRVANVLEGFIDTSDVLEMPFTDSEYRIYRLQEGDILLNEGQSLNLVGRSAIYKSEPLDCCFQNTLIRFRSRPQTDSSYAQHLFQHYQQTGVFASIGTQTTSIAHLGVERFATLKIPLPPLPEQIEIARILTAWDEAIARTSALLDAKTRFKRALMKQLLSGERRFEEFKGQAWRERKLGDVMQLTFRPVAWDEDAVYRLASIRRNSGGLFWRESLRGAQIKVKKLHTIREGDFLVSHIQAAYGAMGRVPAAFDGGQVSEMYSILTPCAPDSIDIGFFDYLSQLPLMHHKVLHSSNGFFAERLRLNFDPLQFMKQTFLLPQSIEEQRAIAEVLDAANAEIAVLARWLDAFKTQKRGLMQLLLSGEKRVTLPPPGA